MAGPAAVLQIWVDAQTTTASSKMTKLNSTMKASEAQANKSSNAIGGKLTKALKVAGTVGAAGMAYGMYKSVKVAADFEKQLDSTGAVAGANAKQLKALEQQALKTGQATFYSANETAKAQEELVKGGLSVKQVLGGALPAALSLAEAGQLDLATAGETTVNVMKLFGLEGRDASKIADMLATAANKTTADVGDFSMALKQGGSVAKLAGLNLSNTVTILEALAESGIKNSDAGTSMKTSLIQLLKPTEKQASLAKALGIEWTTQAGTIKTAAGLSKELREATDGMTKSERAKTLATLAGTDGVRTLNALYDAGPAKLKALERANNKQGTAQEIARKRMGNFAGQVEQLKGSLETLGIKVGQLLIPSLGRLASGATKVANEVTKIFSDKTLSGPEKFKKAFGLVTDRILETVTDVFPKIAEAAAEQAPKTAAAFVKGFVNANVWGKLAVGGFLLAKFAPLQTMLVAGSKAGGSWAKAFAVSASSDSTYGLARSFGRGRLDSAIAQSGAFTSAGIAGAKSLASSVAASVGPALGAVGIANIATSAMGGDWKDAGFEAGGAIAGGIAGFMASGGNPLGAMVGVGLGSIGGELLSGLFVSEKKLTPVQRTLAQTSEALARALGGQRQAAATTADAQTNLQRANSKLHRSTANLSEAEHHLEDVRKHHKEGSIEVLRAEARLYETRQGNKRAANEQRFAEEALAFARKAQGRTIAQVVHDASLAIEGDKQWIAQIKKRISVEGWSKSATEAANKAVQKLARDEGTRSQALGQARRRNEDWAKSLETMTSAQHRFGAQGKALATHIEVLKERVASLRRDVSTSGGPMSPFSDSLGKARRELSLSEKKLTGFISSTGPKLKTWATQGGHNAERMSGSFVSLAGSVRGALENIGGNVDEMLSKLGAGKASKFQLKKFVASLPELKPQGKQRGGAIVPGSGSGDKVHTLLPAGTYILNKKATEAFGLAKGGMMPVALEPGERRFLPHEVAAIGANNLEAMNRAVPRFREGGQLGKPQIAGPAGAMLSIGQGAVDKVYPLAQRYVDKHRQKDGVGGAAFGPKGVGSYMGVPMANWVIQALLHAASKGVAPQPTSGYRSHAYNVAQGRDYKSEHEGTQYPYGAVDFGGYTTGYAAKMAVVNATKGFKYPLLAPIGFEDDGHASGTGHQLGGLIKALYHLAEGGWVKTGYTTYDVDGPGAFGNLMSGKGYAELGTATSTGSGTGTGFIAKALGMSGELPKDYALDVKIRNTIGTLFKRDRGYGQGDPYYSIDIHRLAWPDVGLSGNSKGDAWIRPANGQGGAGKSEDVPAVYHGARTGSLSFGPIPKSLHGISKELGKRRGEAKTYRSAVADAHKKGKSQIEQALTSNLREIEGRIRELERAQAKERREAAKRKITKKFGTALGKLTGFEDLIAAKERGFNAQGQFAEQLVALEPVMPEIPEKATDAQREVIEKGHIDALTRYIGTQEEPAYQVLLGSAAEWRNTILSGQEKAAGHWWKGDKLGGLEGHWEDKIIATGNEIDHGNNYIKKVAGDVAAWKKKHGNDPFPDWLKDEVKKEHQVRARIPILRFQEQELRKVLGEGRQSFYPGKARVRHPIPPFAGSGSLEDALTTVQGVHWPDQHEKITNLPATRFAGAFGGVIWDVQSSIAELGMKIRDARASVERGSSDSGETEGEAFWKEQARLANLRNLVFERQKSIIDAYESKLGFAGMFAKGGSIPAGMWGIAGERGPEPVIGPATVVSNQDAQGVFGGGSTSVLVQVVEGEPSKTKVYVDEKRIEATVEKVNRRQGARARSIGARKAGKGMA